MAAIAQDRRSVGGRPPRPIRRSKSNVPLEANVVDALREQARLVDLELGTYCELVISVAHGYDGPFLPEVDLLPTPLTRDELQARVRDLSRTDVAGAGQLKLGLYGVRVDVPLAAQMRARCDDWGVSLARYLRSVLHIAAAVRPQHVIQDQLLDVDPSFDVSTEKGERQLRAS